MKSGDPPEVGDGLNPRLLRKLLHQLHRISRAGTMIPGENGARCKHHRLKGTAGVRILGRSTEANGTTAGPTRTTRAGPADRFSTEMRVDPAEVCLRAGLFLFDFHQPLCSCTSLQHRLSKRSCRIEFLYLGGMPGEALAHL